jgi:hypothetical protein
MLSFTGTHVTREFSIHLLFGSRPPSQFNACAMVATVVIACAGPHSEVSADPAASLEVGARCAAQNGKLLLRRVRASRCVCAWRSAPTYHALNIRGPTGSAGSSTVLIG